jgi:hypothetical protein
MTSQRTTLLCSDYPSSLDILFGGSEHDPVDGNALRLGDAFERFANIRRKTD